MHHSQLDLDRQLCFSLYRASRAVTRAYRPVLTELGLTYPQYLVMLVLWETEGPLGVGEVGERLGLDSGTLTPLLRRMEQAGLLTRSRGEDERRRLIALTAQGRSLEDRAARVPERMAALYPADTEQAREVKAYLDDLADRLT